MHHGIGNVFKTEKKLFFILQQGDAHAVELINFKIVDTLYMNRKLIFWIHKNIAKIMIFSGVLLYTSLMFLCLLQNTQCLFQAPLDTAKIFRKAEHCEICQDVIQIERVENISQLEFEIFYAHTGKPVVVSDGAVHWPALGLFSFEFLKNLYQTQNLYYNDDSSDVYGCQFFPYNTEFQSLEDVFNMSPERSQLRTGTKPWYIGWSNCNDHVGNILKQYYTYPYFLAGNSENIALNWIFMGGPGYGAHMHVDNVIHPSWQAQLNGIKLWRLMPPPECFYQCNAVSIHVHPGEIIVLDTNKWYHQTIVTSQDVSIAIGSEYD